MSLFRRRDVTQAFRNNRHLQQFMLTDVTPTGKVLGTGSYGSVEEVEYQHLVCAGKKLHEILLDDGNIGVPDVVRKYEQECQIMSSLRHPNITQFLGLCFLPGTRLPLLVMERLETSLDDLLEYMPGLPLSLKCSVLKDVASGLVYLHNRQPQIIHRDLTAKNVLLTSSLVAKITDMGNSRMIDMRPGQLASTLSRLPGTLVYMPPEALNETHRYGPSLDIFSFGHLTLYTMTQIFPGNLLEPSFPDPDDPERVLGRKEVERRGEYIELLEKQLDWLHPALVQLIKQCLHNTPERRPATDQVLSSLQRLKVEVDGLYGGNLVKLDVGRVLLAKDIKMKDKTINELMETHRAAEERIEELARENDLNQAAVADLQRQLQQKQRDMEEKVRQLQQQQRDMEEKDRQLQQQQREMEEKDRQLQQQQRDMEEKDRQLQQQQREMEEKDRQLQQQQREMEVKDRQLLQMQSKIKLKDQMILQQKIEIKVKNEELQQKQRDMEEKDRQLQQQQRDMEVKDRQFQQQQEQYESERQEWENNLCKFRVFMRHPSTNELVERKLEIYKGKTLREATLEAYKILGLSELVPLDRCRLVQYDEYTETLDQSFDTTQEEVAFGFHVGGARSDYSFEIFMEIRPEGSQFKVYNKGGLNLKVLVIDLPEEKVREPVQMRAEQGWTVQQLKIEIANHCGLAADVMVVAIETYQNEGRPLEPPEQTLKSEGFYNRKYTVFVCCDPEDFCRDYQHSIMNRVIDKFSNTSTLLVTVPPPQAQLKGRPSTQPHRQRSNKMEANSTAEVEDMNNEEEVRRDMDDVNRPLQRVVPVQIDCRKNLGDLKQMLEGIVQVPAADFKIYRVYSNNQEYEIFRLQDPLQNVPNETRMIVRLGRALLPGEFRIKLSLLHVNEVEFFKSLLDSIVAKGMTVRELKHRLVKEPYEQGVEFPLKVDRMRLRKKTWRSPGTIYLDDQVFAKDIHVYANYEMFIEPLEGDDPMKHATQLQVYVRHWRPSTYTVDKTSEVILDENTPEHLKKKLSEFSGIPVERVQFAKAFGSFPCEMSVLDLESDLEWNPPVPSINSSPLAIYDDGAIFYFKDSEEQVSELSTDKRTKLQKEEKIRLSGYTGSL